MQPANGGSGPRFRTLSSAVIRRMRVQVMGQPALYILCLCATFGPLLHAVCVHRIQMSLFLPIRNFTVAGFGWPSSERKPARPIEGSANFEQSRITLIAAAWCLLAAGFGPRNLLLADNGEHGTEPLVLDNLGLRDLPQFVKGAVSQLDTLVADRQPAIGIIEHADPLADRRLGLVTRRENENHLVVLQGQRPR